MSPVDKTETLAKQRSFRLPRDEYEAWLAGLIVTDGTVNRKWGYTRVTQKAQAAPLFELLGKRFGRNVNYETQQSNFGLGHKVHLNFKDLPVRWKSAVPAFQPFSDLERHYWRGVIDGDGSVVFNQRRPTNAPILEVRLAFNPRREGFLGRGFAAFLDRLGIPYTFATDQDAHSIHKIRVRQKDYSRQLARYLYEDAEIALPWKMERALS